jgi:hypothetical protein
MTAEEFREVLVERIKFRSATQVSGELVNDAVEINVVADFVTRQWYAMADWRIAGKTWEAESVHVPDGWWQALKAEVFPSWLRRRFRPRLRRIPTKTVRVCPHLTMPSGYSSHVFFLQEAPPVGVPLNDERPASR